MISEDLKYHEIANTALNKAFDSCPTIIKSNLEQSVEVRIFEDGEVFIKEGDLGQGIFLIGEGGVKMYKKSQDKENIFMFKAPYEFIGVQPVFSESSYNFCAAAMGKTVLVYIPLERIKKFIQTYPSIYFSMLKSIDKTAKELEYRSTTMMTESAEDHVLKSLETLEDQFGTDESNFINLRIPVKELAGYLGMSKTNLYRVLESLGAKSKIYHRLNKYRITRSSEMVA